VTLNGASTSMSGAVVAVGPVTDTLPVAPRSVHSGVPPLCGIADGHVLAGAATDDDTLLTALADVMSALEPHAASITASDAAQAAVATGEHVRDDVTAADVTAAGRDRARHAGLQRNDPHRLQLISEAVLALAILRRGRR